MEKMIVADKTEIEIASGASTGSVTAVTASWTDLGAVADTLRKLGNLDSVQFKTGDTVTGEYKDMKLESQLFTAVDIVEGKIHATFCIRQKTEMELAIEQLQRQQAETNASQEIQDGAIVELAGMMGGEV